MGLLQAICDRVSTKKPCYECQHPTAAKHLHRVQYNFHGTLSQHDVCDACYDRMKLRRAAAANRPAG